jgi:hypothetical protein
MSEIVKLTDLALEKAQGVKNPVGAYLTGLGGPASRRTQLTALGRLWRLSGRWRHQKSPRGGLGLGLVDSGTC